VQGEGAAVAEVVVEAGPEDAFRLFTEEVGLWWRRDTPYWNDRERGQSIVIEPGVGGRFLEVYDAEAGTGFEVGRVTRWEPGARLELTWTQANWPEDVVTGLDITFAPVAGGTRVRLAHTGFDRVPGGDDFRAGYAGGWKAILGWFAEWTEVNEKGE
jgi:uncharacterized protein YndB with AHSA1/START domain